MIWIAMIIAVTLWWLMTGLALLSVHQQPPISRVLFTATTFCVAGAMLLMSSNSLNDSVMGVITGFVMALVVWGWLELIYLMGYLTGPNKYPASETTWPSGLRFRRALGTTLHHEILVLAILLIVFLQTVNGPNLIIFKTLGILWIMRCSTKLNLFFGVRHFNESWLPETMKYVSTYVRIGKNSPLMSMSTFAAALITLFLFLAGLAAANHPAALSMYLLAWLAALAVLEHFFLMYPMGESALWRWADPTTTGIKSE